MDFSLSDHQKLIRDTVRQFMETEVHPSATRTVCLRAVDALASGKLPPPLGTSAYAIPRKGRPPHHCVDPAQR
jgi:hypothetical protein